ncbi:MAG: YceI family protein [Bacteroidota bacterium]|nr:YceI family protein [Bacteroidota bacterium]
MKKILVLILTVAALGAAQNKWKIEKSHSNVNFAVTHLIVSEVTGKFKDFSGTIENSKEDFSDMKLDIAINANSVDTDEPKRDGHLKGPDFFNAAVDSIVTFKSTKVEKTSDGKFKVTGDLMMRGVTRQVVLDVQLKGKTKNPWGQTVAIFKSNTTINRTEWGLKWNKGLEAGGLLVGENVDLTFNVELVQG